jgi:uncharacterized protein
VLRPAAAKLAELTARYPVVLVAGPHQSGKTTLISRFAGSADLAGDADLAGGAGFVGMVRDDVRDDAALADELAAGAAADPAPGRFLLAASRRLPGLAAALGGRLGYLELWPLSMAERTGQEDAAGGFAAGALADAGRLVTDSGWTREQYAECIAAGGFPAAIRLAPGDRGAWYDAYLAEVTAADGQQYVRASESAALRGLLTLIASRAGGPHKVLDLAVNIDRTQTTARRYLAKLDGIYQTIRLPGWQADFQLVKGPKVYPCDSGLAAHLLGAAAAELADPRRRALAPLLATFAAGEIVKSLGGARLYHLRNEDLTDVDFVLEAPDGTVAGVNVTTGSGAGPRPLKGLRWLRGRIRDRMRAGIVLHLGTQADYLGDDMYSLPLSVLWNHGVLR